MNVYDIRKNILLRLPTDQLINACVTDQLAYQICSDEVFWIQKFDNENLPIINAGTNIAEWIEEYSHVKRTITSANLLIKNIKNGAYDRNDIYVSFNSLSSADILHIPEIDTNFINLVYDRYLLEAKLLADSDVPDPQLIISYKSKNNWLIRLEYYDVATSSLDSDLSHEWNVSESSIFTLLFNLIYNNIRIYDNRNDTITQ